MKIETDFTDLSSNYLKQDMPLSKDCASNHSIESTKRLDNFIVNSPFNLSP